MYAIEICLQVSRVLLRIAWLVMRFLLRWLMRIMRVPPATFGSARFVTRRELRKAGVLSGNGLILAKDGSRLLRYNQPEGSVLVFAPQGAGKGVGLVIPNLLDYQGSVICTDPKGENYAVTARARAMLGPVWRLNLGDAGSSHSFNPLDLIDPGAETALDDAKVLADLMLPHDVREEGHWRRRAHDILTGFLLYVAERNRKAPELKTLAELHRLLCASRAAFEATLKTMQASSSPRVRDVAGQLLRSLDVEETSNILSNILKGTEPWGAGGAAAAVSGWSDFDLQRFYRERQSLYLIVPEELLSVYAGVLRVMVGLAMNAVFRAGRLAAPPPHRPLFLLDECAALGYLEPLEKGMGYLRAYGRAMLIFQDVHQLEATYPRARSIIANSAVQVAFAVNDDATARMLSERLGQTTVTSRSSGMSQPWDALLHHQAQAGFAEAGRALLDPAEILRLPREAVLVFMGGVLRRPVLATRLVYFLDKRFKGRFDAWRDARAATPPASADSVPPVWQSDVRPQAA
ncbi:MAG: type IV secretory system conjugative DNA transfer family protein, partial [Rhodospirillales bacterium]|nr:type IV secretory system conjugative DNA transfer family protein [Rhodospirillales bacterium]